MDGNGIAAVVCLFLIFSGVSNASSLWKVRKLADVAPNNGSAGVIPTVSPPRSSGTVVDKKSDPKVDDSGKSHGDSSKLDPKVSNRTGSAPPPLPRPEAASGKTDSVGPPPQNLTDSGKNSDLNDKDAGKSKGINEEENNKKGEEIDSGQSLNSNNTGDTEKDKETKEAEGKKKNDSEDKNELQDKQTKEGEGKKNDLQPVSGETCEEVPKRCKDENSLVACIKNFESGSKELGVIIQNEGEETLEVNLMVSTSMENSFKLAKHETKRVNISLASIQSDKLIVSAGHGNCVLHMDSLVSGANFFFHVPSYDKLVTPINGAYFLIATVLIFVAAWACCKFRNSRRRLDGIPYQELEMGRPDSMSATEVETAEGWDQGWDDDWDEEHAVKSPAGRHLGNISANGLTARSSNKDGWEGDWDD